MNKRLPAEIVSRRVRPVVKQAPQHAQVEKDDSSHVTLDLRQILDMNPDKRARWLSKALQQAQDGRVVATDVYDVVAHARFASELSEKAGRRCYRVLHANLSLFSSKQQRFIEKECELAVLFRANAWEKPPAGDEKADNKEASAAAMEEMMARCRAFVREKQTERGDKDLASALEESGGGYLRGAASAEEDPEEETPAPAAAASEAPLAGAAGEEASALPPGWERFDDPASGHPYYVHRASGTTQWLPPTAEEIVALAAASSSSAAAAAASAGEDGKRKDKSRSRSRSKSKAKERAKRGRSSSDSSGSSRRKKKKRKGSSSSSRSKDRGKRSRSKSSKRESKKRRRSSSSASSGSKARDKNKRR